VKILILSTSDIDGGAARAAYRLHTSLLDAGIESQMLVKDKHSIDPTVICISNSKIQKGINALRPSIDRINVNRYKPRSLFSQSWVGFNGISEQINKINPDIVHLHWICGGLIRIEDIAKIQAKIIWNCHDMWPFTGGCHYDEYCAGYKTGCGSCPILESRKKNDLSRVVFRRKLATYKKMKELIVVGSSKWISTCARESCLFSDKKVITLKNCINTKLFKPIDKNIVKDLFNIPKNKKVILLSAMNVIGDKRKGARELFEAVNILNIEDAIVVVAGSEKSQVYDIKYPLYHIEPLKDEVSLSLMYNIADVLVVPSLQENLANTIVEGLSCGIPVVAFNIGGNPDLIDHKIDGYLAEDFSASDLAFGIKWVLSHENYSKLSNNARRKILNEFDSHDTVQKYLKIYRDLLE
jgi:glycosyltransferase involved in cell wall biosynthesis